MWIPVAAIAAWAAIIIYRMHLVGQTREHAHRERLAMIEKGLTPPPADPVPADQLSNWRMFGGDADRRADARRTGIILIGVGAGLAWMLSLIGAREAAGIGALLVVMGLAFLVVSMLERKPPSAEKP